MSALVYLNGQMIPAGEASLPIYDAGIVQGATVTVQTRTFHRKLWRLEERLDSLLHSLEYARMNIELSREDLRTISHQLIEQNAPEMDDRAELGLIHFVTAGEYPTYAVMAGRPARRTPTVCIHTFPLPFQLWATKLLHGAHLVVPSVRHVPPACWSPQIKCRSRMHWYLADQEARLTDPEAAALLLDLDGYLTETNTGNLILARDGCLLSPTTRNILPGHSRSLVMELASRLDIPFREQDLRIEDALHAEEAFLTSTPYCILPVSQINGQAIGSSIPGPLTRRLQQAWSQEVGLDIAQQIIDRGS